MPDWADADGIIPLTEADNERTLLQRLIVERNSFRSPEAAVTREDAGNGGDGGGREEDACAGSGMNSVLLREFAELMGKPLEQWLATEFFKHHMNQFKKRPIAWQVQSGRFTSRSKPAFGRHDLQRLRADGDRQSAARQPPLAGPSQRSRHQAVA